MADDGAQNGHDASNETETSRDELSVQPSIVDKPDSSSGGGGTDVDNSSFPDLPTAQNPKTNDSPDTANEDDTAHTLTNAVTTITTSTPTISSTPAFATTPSTTTSTTPTTTAASTAPAPTSRKRLASKSAAGLKKETTPASRGGPKKRKVSADPGTPTTSSAGTGTTAKKTANRKGPKAVSTAAKKNTSSTAASTRKKANGRTTKKGRRANVETETSDDDTGGDDDAEEDQASATDEDDEPAASEKEVSPAAPTPTVRKKRGRPKSTASSGLCLCGGPESLSRMIACDECNEWFHSTCLGYKDSDCDVIDTFICPRCEPQLASQTDRPNKTTWKPLCRVPGCPNLARLDAQSVGADGTVTVGSKYCSDQCGVSFFAYMIAKSGAAGQMYRKRALALAGGGRTDDGSEEEDEDLERVREGGGDAKHSLYRQLGDWTKSFMSLDEAENIQKAVSYMSSAHSSDSDPSPGLDKKLVNGTSTGAEGGSGSQFSSATKHSSRLRGEPLRAEHLRSILDYTSLDIDTFLRLGQHPSLFVGKGASVLGSLRDGNSVSSAAAESQSKTTQTTVSAPASAASATAASTPKLVATTPAQTEAISFTRSEQKHLSRLAKRKSALLARRHQLLERLKFVDLCRSNVAIYNAFVLGPEAAAAAAAAGESGTAGAATAAAAKPTRGRAPNPRLKEVCGFDTRLTWNDGEWWRWWSAGGRPVVPRLRKVGEAVTLVATSDKGKAKSATRDESLATGSNGDADADPEADADPDATQISSFICVLKRCDKHRQWQNLHLQDVRLDLATVAEEVDKLEKEADEVRSCAVLRSRQGWTGPEVGGREGGREGLAVATGGGGGGGEGSMDGVVTNPVEKDGVLQTA